MSVFEGRGSGSRVRVAVILDVRIYRDSVAELLRKHDALEVIGSYDSLAAAQPDLRARAPDVILLDASHPDGLRAVRSIRALHPSIEIVGLNVSDEAQDIIACAEAGVSGFVARGASPSELGQALLDAMRGELRCSSKIAGNLLGHVRALASGRTSHEPARLTRRELEVAHLIDLGLSNKEIADRLCIGLSTVKNHVHKVLEKSNTRRRGEAAARLRPRLVELSKRRA